MIGTIAIYRGTGSLASGEHPYFALGATVNPTPVKSYQGKFTEDLDQVVNVPTFDGWSSCNLCRLSSGSYKRWYWITDISRVSDNGSSVQLALTYCPTMDVSERADYTVSQKLRGDWTRLPHVDPSFTANFEVAGGTEVRQSILMEPKTLWDRVRALDSSHTAPKGVLCWAQLTWIGGGQSSDRQSIKQAGFIVDMNMPNSGITIGSTSVASPYITCQQLINNLYDSTAIVPSDVIDLSLSPYCPFCITCPDANSIAVSDTEGGTAVNPTGFLNINEEIKVYGYFYESSKLGVYEERVFVDMTNLMLFCGSVRFTDPLGNTRGNFPLGLRGNKLQCRVVCIGDTTGMYLRVFFSRNMVQLPMYHIPYIGTQWDQYRAYSLSLDRQAMEYSISSSREALQIQKDTATANAALSIASSVMSGNIGGALSTVGSTLIGQNAQNRQQMLSEQTQKYNQALTEKRVQSSAPTTYMQSTGFQDVLNYLEGSCALEWWAAPGTDTATFTNYYLKCGAPCSRYNYTSAVESDGYYQGRLYTDGAPVHGPCFDRLAELYAGGVLKVLYKDVTE